jgi:hypothetical protein
MLPFEANKARAISLGISNFIPDFPRILSVFPSASVRIFSPTRVITLVHLRFRVHGPAVVVNVHQFTEEMAVRRTPEEELTMN